MEELLTLKELLLKGDIPGSLALVEELEEMSKKEIIKTIRSYAVILLLHLIKQQAEQRTTRSWEVLVRSQEQANSQSNSSFAQQIHNILIEAYSTITSNKGVRIFIAVPHPCRFFLRNLLLLSTVAVLF